MSYIGSTPTTQSFISGTDYFNGDGSTTAFTLSRSVVSTNDIEAVINNVVQQPNSAYTVSGTTITFTSAPSSGTSNIYVRYLSTTTQSITPSQNTVSYSTLNSDNQSKLGISFKNRIINGAMVINQRGGTISASNSGWQYGIDRWACYQNNASSKFTIQQSSTAATGFTNSLLATSSSAYTVGAGEVFNVRQVIEGYNTADLAWGTANAKTVTISFWVNCSVTGTFGGIIGDGNASTAAYPFTYTVNAANTWEQKSITVVGPTIGTWVTNSNGGPALYFSMGCGSTYLGTAGAWTASTVYGATGQTNLVATNGATFYVTGVQLEVGTQATTFDYRSYGTELSLCQRYYEKIGGENSYDFYMDAYNNAGTVITCPLYWKVTKRTNPSVGVTGTPGYGNCNSLSVAGSGAGTNNTTVQASVVSTGRAYCYFPSGTYFAISAEL
jgi:hypothetical protein